MPADEDLLISTSEEQTESAGFHLGSTLEAGAVVALTGPLGCGKTVFTRGVARALAVEEPVTSPSFVIVAQYRGRLPLYHIDLYRLEHAEEAEEIGLRELLYGSGVSVIEWGERAAALLPPATIRICFRILSDGTREIRRSTGLHSEERR